MTFTLIVPNLSKAPQEIELKLGSSTFFVGANGSGKTRLAAFAEDRLGAKAHRIAAHRSLSLNALVTKTSEKQARAGLRFGHDSYRDEGDVRNRSSTRWSGKAATILLNDFDFLLQALFANQTNVALETHKAATEGSLGSVQSTHFHKLATIWCRVLPHRKLEITGDEIKVTSDGQIFYNASEMSDGERTIFYLLGQALVAEPDSVIIFDEPELHVHRAVLGKLWDEIEAARPDCSFLVITHDLEFAASRPGQKFVLQSYAEPGNWEIEAVPEDTGFTEEVVTMILGSRRPVLFVEGTDRSLDVAIYRACFPEWTVVPRGSCESVIQSVVSMRNNATLTRITCSGVVDADAHTVEEKERLARLGIEVLPVAEIENLFLLRSVSVAILEGEGFSGGDLNHRIIELTADVLKEVSRPSVRTDVVLRFCRRRIDRAVKDIDLKAAANKTDLVAIFADGTSRINIEELALEMEARIDDSVKQRDIDALMSYFDNKAFLALAARHLKGHSLADFKNWIIRVLRGGTSEKLRAALNEALPKPSAA